MTEQQFATHQPTSKFDTLRAHAPQILAVTALFLRIALLCLPRLSISPDLGFDVDKTLVTTTLLVVVCVATIGAAVFGAGAGSGNMGGKGEVQSEEDRVRAKLAACGDGMASTGKESGDVKKVTEQATEAERPGVGKDERKCGCCAAKGQCGSVESKNAATAGAPAAALVTPSLGKNQTTLPAQNDVESTSGNTLTRPNASKPASVNQNSKNPRRMSLSISSASGTGSIFSDDSNAGSPRKLDLNSDSDAEEAKNSKRSTSVNSRTSSAGSRDSRFSLLKGVLKPGQRWADLTPDTDELSPFLVPSVRLSETSNQSPDSVLFGGSTQVENGGPAQAKMHKQNRFDAPIFARGVPTTPNLFSSADLEASVSPMRPICNVGRSRFSTGAGMNGLNGNGNAELGKGGFSRFSGLNGGKAGTTHYKGAGKSKSNFKGAGGSHFNSLKGSRTGHSISPTLQVNKGKNSGKQNHSSNKVGHGHGAGAHGSSYNSKGHHGGSWRSTGVPAHNAKGDGCSNRSRYDFTAHECGFNMQLDGLAQKSTSTYDTPTMMEAPLQSQQKNPIPTQLERLHGSKLDADAAKPNPKPAVFGPKATVRSPTVAELSTEGRYQRISRNLAKFLRHRALSCELCLDSEGYAELKQLLRLGAFRKLKTTEQDVSYIVGMDAKKRYGMRKKDGKVLIRANQGHSSVLQIDDSHLHKILTLRELPEVLVHYSYSRHWGSILHQGLKSQSRDHIHLCECQNNGYGFSCEGAEEALPGVRASAEIAIFVDTNLAVMRGCTFLKSTNGVILTRGTADGANIPPACFRRVVDLKVQDRVLWPLYLATADDQVGK